MSVGGVCNQASSDRLTGMSNPALGLMWSFSSVLEFTNVFAHKCKWHGFNPQRRRAASPLTR